jgi:hypothetical protein
MSARADRQDTSHFGSLVKPRGRELCRLQRAIRRRFRAWLALWLAASSGRSLINQTLENQSQQSLFDPRRRVKRFSATFFGEVSRLAFRGLIDGTNGSGGSSVVDRVISGFALGHLVRLAKLCRLLLTGHVPAGVG